MKEKIYQQKFKLDKIDKIKYYVAFSYLLVRPIIKSKIFEYFNYDIKKSFEVSKEELAEISEFYNIKISSDFIKKRDKIDIEKCYQEAFLDKNVKILTYEDEKYPKLLKEIPDFPLSLYYKGDINSIDDKFNLAVVGSRNATNEAKIALNNIICGLKNSNLTIISGLAYGIDAQAHISAINSNLKTIGVIGCGLDIIYPTQNKKIYDDIISGAGVILSEFPLKTQPMPQNFPQRNRIVVGISKGTLVAEARKKSGAMISANLTLDYNRELMCMPGNVLNPNTEGIYYLIKNGASIVIESKDILNNLDWEIELENTNCDFNINDKQKKVYDIISYEAKTFDEIIEQMENPNISETMVTLTELELQGLIKQSNNKYYKCK